MTETEPLTSMTKNYVTQPYLGLGIMIICEKINLHPPVRVSQAVELNQQHHSRGRSVYVYRA